MPVYTIRLEDGRRADIRAPDQAAAVAAAVNIPKLEGEKADYQRELVKGRERNALHRKDSERFGLGGFNALSEGSPLPYADELAGVVGGIGNEAANLVRRFARKPTVSSRAVYEGIRDASNEWDSETKRLHPIAAPMGTLLSGLATGPGKAGVGMLAQNLGRKEAIKQAVKVGGITGAAAGAGEGRTVPERLLNAVVGGGIGAGTGGLLEGVALPAAGYLGRVGGGVIKDAVRVFKKPVAAEEAAKGTRSAIEILQRKGLTAANVPEKAAPYGRVTPTAAELGGKETERNTAVIARRGGKTGDAASDIVAARNEGRPGRILDAINEELGVNAKRAQGDVDDTVEMGRRLADPEYDIVRANEAGIWSPELEELSQRPIIREAMANARLLGQDTGRGSEGLAMGNVDVPSRPVGPHDANMVMPPSSMPVPRGPAEPPPQGRSALTFLRDKGHGIAEDMVGEAQQAGLRLGARSGGAELRDMANRLEEGGYTPRRLEDHEVLPWLEEHGRTTYAREADAAALQRHEARKSAEEFNARGGDPNDPSLPNPEDYGNAGPAPERPMQEPAHMTAPTGESWDIVQRTLDSMVKRDPITKQVIRHGDEGLKNERARVASNDLRRVIVGDDVSPGQVPHLREARAVAHDAQSIRDAFERGRGWLVKGSTRDFGKYLGSLTSAAQKKAFKEGKTVTSSALKEAAKSAMATDLYEMWSTGQVKAGRFGTDRIKSRMKLMFGDKEAERFITQLKKEAELAASGGRIAPQGGSATAGLGEGGKELDAASQFGAVGRIAGKVARGKLWDAAGDTLGTMAAYGKSAGMSEEARDAFGKVMLMEPDELAKELAHYESLTGPIKQAVSMRARMLGMTSGVVAGEALGGDRPDR